MAGCVPSLVPGRAKHLWSRGCAQWWAGLQQRAGAALGPASQLLPSISREAVGTLPARPPASAEKSPEGAKVRTLSAEVFGFYRWNVCLIKRVVVFYLLFIIKF